MSIEELEATPTSLEITDGMKGVRDRISVVPKRVTLDGAPRALSTDSGSDFGDAARKLTSVERSLDGLWPVD